jgi:hypothetical protein
MDPSDLADGGPVLKAAVLVQELDQGAPLTEKDFKGTVAPDIFIFFMMSIIKSVLFVWPLISLIFFLASLILYLLTKF